MENKKRLLNIEIIRIIAIVLIMFHHVVLYSNLKFSGISYYIWEFFRVGGKYGVILFVLITGYFEGEKEFRFQKIIKLLIHTIFYSYLFFLMFLIFFDKINIINLKKSLFPFLFNQYWFINTYIILYLCLPFVNKFIKMITKNCYQKLLVILSLFICILPSLTCSNFQIGSLGIFIYIYLIGAYIKKYNFTIKIAPKINLLISLISYMIAYILNISVANFISNYNNNYISLNSVFMYISAISLFKVFSNLKIEKCGNLISFFSRTTLGVYLIHENVWMRSFVWKNVLDKIINLNLFNSLIIAICYVIFLYLICTIIDYLYLRFVEKYLIQIFNKFINFFKKICFKLKFKIIN